MPAPKATEDRSPATIKALLAKAKEEGGPLAMLRVPFASNQIGLLPRNLKKGDMAKSGCRPGTDASADGKFCGGYHARSVHLDYVGHAALTDRLLEADPEWEWEPLALDEQGLPKFDQYGGLWIRLTVAGKTKLGYGDAQEKQTGSTAVKEIIGDALRNAGMRFGMALDLWHKGDLHDMAEEQGNVGTNAPEGTDAPKAPATRQRRAPAAGVEAVQAVIPGAVEIKDENAPDFLKQAADAKTRKDAGEIWQAAHRRFGENPTKEQNVILDTITKRGVALAAEERQALEANAVAAEKAAAALKAGFEGKTPPHDPSELV